MTIKGQLQHVMISSGN